MQEHEKTFWSLLLLGALIAIGKVLSSDEPITPRLFIGRVILGTGTAMVAGAALIWVPGLPTLGVVGVGAAWASPATRPLSCGLNVRAAIC